MAYRKLYDGDLVRITGSQVSFTGRNAIVIDAGVTMSRVQVQGWTHFNEEPTNCLTLNNKHLIIRHEPHGYIVDGRIDPAKKSALEARRVAYHKDELEEEDEFYDYDRDDLIDMIVKLRNDVATLFSLNS
jgi:hypothetical protein